ncbi:portal protein [Paraburkholderia silvatlantica]|uniref:Phage P22-like portal protein n=1 Tax=Paraburkholderia silvatlantica TaxID=321895 RepID=A0ABR6FLS3_9BURK|nr:portal protein [Paraburkholderia silvatlantica]MBB2928386.1 hypothetical protein [Paraburkholderia silvatlantica]PVY34569.1 phage P22-like portal protein [Paraburkholderia silvatlantica]PXW38784.1 phage P22-like portal protein [Paraburkholderia silvatlantica]
MAKSRSGSIPAVVREAQECLKTAIEAETQNRAEGIKDLKFGAGEQWPEMIQTSRELEHRPCLVVNKTDSFVRQTVNNMREQRPRIQVHAVASGADKQKADVIAGLMRHIQTNSNADVAYDTASDFQVRIGWGYWRIAARYTAPDSFDQELYIDRVRNPFTVYFDPASSQPDGSDANWCVITDLMSREKFQRKWPKAKLVDLRAVGAGDELHQWATKDEIRVAEYWKVEHVPDTLLLFSNGDKRYRSEVKQEDLDAAAANGLRVVKERDTVRRAVKWYKLTALEVLEEREWPGKWIPVVPVYGAEYELDGKVVRYGMIRMLQDPQRMYNFWRTAEAELVALAPKAPWLVAEGQIEGQENVWNSANNRSFAYLSYKPQSLDGHQVPPPIRQQPQQLPSAQVNAAMGASEDMKAVAGMFDPALGAEGQETSGVMVQRRQAQSDKSNFHFYDNLCRSIRHTGHILLDLIPHYYDVERTIRIIGEDGVPDSVTINQKQMDPLTGAIQEVLNDVTVGEYDVVIDTGPGYQTKREEAADHMLQLLGTPLGQKVSMIADDVILRQFDWPGADLIADRLAAANPIAQAEQNLPENIPDEVRAVIAQLQAQLKQSGALVQQLQTDLKYKLSVEQMRQQGDAQRTSMQDSTKRHDIESRDQTALELEEIKGHVAILLAHMNDRREIAAVEAAAKNDATH